jgi:hypothetical protein
VKLFTKKDYFVFYVHLPRVVHLTFFAELRVGVRVQCSVEAFKSVQMCLFQVFELR